MRFTSNTTEGGDRRHISIEEFVELGYLQEVNRRFFHPLGLALEVDVFEDGSKVLGGVWDCRDDQEGIMYADQSPEARARRAERAKFIDSELERLAGARVSLLGASVQPV